ncbi:MAG: hypothetical protein IAF58_15955 [Leptolyngbya sp.]|nr:hypothetical protein [Candidatus Melainabacteria bacterium]
MPTRFQYAILAIVYGLVVVVGLSLLYPTIIEDTEKSTDLTQHVQQKEQLDTKLKDRLKIAQEKQALEADIASLRNAVPKDANIDLLLIDLEKLALRAGVDLIGVEAPGAEDVKASQKDIMDMLGKPDPKNSAAAAEKKVSVSPTKNKPADLGSELGLQQIDREIFVTGNYSSMVQFVRNIEAYERIMGVSHVVIAVPKQDSRGESDKSSDRGKKLKLSQPVMSFLLSIYYLP